MAQDDGFQFLPHRIAVLSGEHIHFPLIDAQLANIGFEEEDIGTLHNRVENLGSVEIVFFAASHDHTAFLDSTERRVTRNIEHLSPVGDSIFFDFLGSPEKLNVIEIHTGSFPDLGKTTGKVTTGPSLGGSHAEQLPNAHVSHPRGPLELRES